MYAKSPKLRNLQFENFMETRVTSKDFRQNLELCQISKKYENGPKRNLWEGTNGLIGGGLRVT